MEEIAQSQSLTHKHWSVLSAIAPRREPWEKPGLASKRSGASIRELLDRTSDMDIGSIRKIANSLVRKSLSAWRGSKKNHEDRLVLTRKGRNTLAALGKKSTEFTKEIDRRFAKKYNPKHRDALYHALDELQEIVRRKIY